MTTKAQKAAEKAAQAAAADPTATEKTPDREPMADAPAAPALPDMNNPETTDGLTKAGSETMDTAEADTEVAETTASAAGELGAIGFPSDLVHDDPFVDTDNPPLGAAGHAREGDDLKNANKEDVVLIQMRRDAPLHDGGPTEADVHPDEVENWQAVGWVIDA